MPLCRRFFLLLVRIRRGARTCFFPNTPRLKRLRRVPARPLGRSSAHILALFYVYPEHSFLLSTDPVSLTFYPTPQEPLLCKSRVPAPQVIRRFGVTAFIAVPTMLADLVAINAPCPSVRRLLLGGGCATHRECSPCRSFRR